MCIDNTEDLEAAHRLLKQSGGTNLKSNIIWGIGGALLGILTYKAVKNN